MEERGKIQKVKARHKFLQVNVEAKFSCVRGSMNKKNGTKHNASSEAETSADGFFSGFHAGATRSC